MGSAEVKVRFRCGHWKSLAWWILMPVMVGRVEVKVAVRRWESRRRGRKRGVLDIVGI